MKARFLTTCIILLSWATVFAGPKDSVGTKVKNGVVYIMHKVEKAQGLFAISRQYNVSLDKIIQHNPGSDENLILDQIILIPTNRRAPQTEKVVTDYFTGQRDTSIPNESDEKTTFAKYHLVKKGQTLYAISIMYNTEVDVLKNLNNLEDNSIKEGMELMVPSGSEEKILRTEKLNQAQKKADSLKKEIKDARINIQTSENADNSKMGSIANSKTYVRKVENLLEFDIEKIWESGVVSLMADNDNSKKHRICSHHDAEIGTTVMVMNPENDKAVFVKVVKNHALDKETANIVMLSQAAMDYAGLLSGNSVEISFAR